MAISNQYRIKSSFDYAEVKRNGRSSAGEFVLVSYLKKERKGMAHFGMITSKRLGNAVVRNRLRRRLRMIARPYLSCLGSLDIVTVALRKSTKASFCSLQRDWGEQIKKLEILKS